MFIFLVLGTLLLETKGQTGTTQSPVPKDLEITLSLGGTIQFSTHYTYRIASDGSVLLEYQHYGLPISPRFETLLKLENGEPVRQEKPKTTPPKKPKRLSQDQLKILLNKFETSGFFSMADRYSYGEALIRYHGDSSIRKTTCVNHAEEKSLSIVANGRKKSVSFFLGCTYGEMSPLKDFLSLYDSVSKAMKNVEVKTVDTLKPKS